MAKSRQPRTQTLKGYKVNIAGLGPFREGQLLSAEQLTQAGVTEARFDALLGNDTLIEIWE
jgi:hypothetical protein